MNCRLCHDGSANVFEEAYQRVFYRCKNCCLIFADPKNFPSSEQELERYLHHRNNKTNEAYRTYIEKLLQPLVTRVAKESIGLDFGCGPVKLVETLLDERGIAGESFDPFFFPGNSRLDKRYDFIFCAETAEHFHAPDKEFDKLDALLKPNGLLELVTGLYHDDQSFSDWWYIRDFTHVVFYSEETLKWLTIHYDWDVEFRDGDVTLFRKLG